MKNKLKIVGLIIFFVGIMIVIMEQCLGMNNNLTHYNKTLINYSILSFSLLLILGGGVKNIYLRSITVVLFSVLFSVFAWAGCIGDHPFWEWPVFLGGMPAGLVAAILFLIIDYFWIRKNTKLLTAKRILCYLILLFIVSIIVSRGKDWWFLFTQWIEMLNKK